MKHCIEIDHIGYAVKNLDEVSKHYVDAGWSVSKELEEPSQNVKLVFLTKKGFPRIELVTPKVGGSPIDKLLEREGNVLYHICYVVDDVDSAIEDLYEEGFRPLFMPQCSPAMEGRRFCYLYSVEVGTIEIVSK